MKRIFLMLTLTAALFSSACAGKTQDKTNTEKMEKKILVAYFSATGTTERVAKMVAEATGGELYEIEPDQKYTAADLDWTDRSSRSSVENDNPNMRPALRKTKESLSDYDVIYLGFPNWWNMAPRIINTFVETYDLGGKTVIPFSTSGGSGIENSVSQLRKLYPDVNWQDGKMLNGATKKTISEWVDKQD